MANLRSIADVSAQRIWEGVTARPVVGERITFAVVELEPDAVVPEHTHPNEQVGMVLAGHGRFRIGDEERAVGPGDTWRILGGVPHSLVVGPKGATVIDVFSPPRTDWDGLPPADGPVARWPRSD